MENPNFEEEKCIELINNESCFHDFHQGRDEGEIIKNPIFKKWLKEQIRNKGRGGLYLCDECNIYSYLKSGKDFMCKGEHCHSKYICLYCGHDFYGDCYCCAKNGLKHTFRGYLFEGCYSFHLRDGIKIIPYIFNLIFVGTIYFGLFFHRRIKYGDNKYSNYEHRKNLLPNCAFIIAILFFLVVSIVYFIPFIFIYLSYLIFFLVNYNGIKS